MFISLLLGSTLLTGTSDTRKGPQIGGTLLFVKEQFMTHPEIPRLLKVLGLHFPLNHTQEFFDYMK